MEHYKNLSLENIVEEIDGVVYTEEWKDIQGYEGYYQVSSFGRIKSLARQHINKPSKASKSGHIQSSKTKIIRCTTSVLGYVRCNLCKQSKVTSIRVHIFVAKAFIKNPENKQQINHIKGIRTANHFTQLEWCTNQENSIHSVIIGHTKVGEDSHTSKITNETARTIKLRLSNGIKPKYIIKELGVNRSTISNIQQKKAWKHIHI